MRYIKPEIWVGVAAITLGLAMPLVAVAAPEEGGRHHEMMQKLDTNHDGKVSQSEWKTASDARFTRTDANGDGFVSRDEMMAEREKHNAEIRKTRGESMFGRADIDSDGKLSKAEYDAGAQKMYERMMTHRGPPPRDQE
ncbi:MAG: EF-hand domain-containing protein [Parvibaculum sp.]|nr:EF-hand domain-containing protein [Parvibaculum sp.]